MADYLDEVGKRTETNCGLTVESILRTGVPYGEILDEARRPDVDVILMTTHGRTSFEPERLGTVADKVVRAGLVLKDNSTARSCASEESKGKVWGAV